MEAAEKATQDLGLPKDRSSRVVDLSNKELGRLPPELAEFTDLQLLTLKKNKLNALGPEIGMLSIRLLIIIIITITIILLLSI